MKRDSSEKLRRVLPLALLLASAVLNVILLLSNGESEPSESPLEVKRKEYPLLAQRILSDQPNAAIMNFVPLRNQIHRYVGQASNKIGVYFQYLPTGISVGYNENEPFVSASLLKLPTVMKVYRMIEDGKVTMRNVLEVRPEFVDAGYGGLWKEGQGNRVSVEEAIVLSLTSSDNTAHRLLYAMSEGRPSDIYEYLDMDLTSVSGETAVTPRNYTSILRSLYFSAYLTLEHSNEVLTHLTRVAEGEVLRSTIPAAVPIAQKIGVRQFDRGSNQVYSYCGIFYVPARPYTLCIMTIADKETAAAQAREISRMVYDFLSAR